MKLYNYHKIDINLLKSLHKQGNWYSRVEKLNDPYELFLNDNTDTQVYNRFKKAILVCSFSKNRNEILMWSHYADNHKGVCLEWEINEKEKKDSLFEINYNNEIIALNEIELTQTGHLSLNVETNGKFLNQKFTMWSYEEEIRFIRIEKDLTQTGSYANFPGKLSAIYFGKNSNEDDITLVKKNSNHFEGIKYYKIDLDTSTMKNDILIEL